MKMRPPVMVLLSVILIFVCCAGDIYAGNPTSYKTIHDPYYRAPGNSSFGFGVTLEALSGGYIPYLRVFIPPGTIKLDLLIEEGGKQMAMSHHKTPPTTPLPSSYSHISQPSTLAQLETGDCLSTETLQGDLYIAHDSILPPYLSLSRAGWLYVKVGGGTYSQTYYNNFTVQVDTKTYNEWWDKNGSNKDGSINWENDVESVEKYVDPTTMAVSVMPSNQPVPKDVGTTTFSVSKTGTGTMTWTAAVVPDSSWLTITSGASGTNSGTITCSFPANTSPSARTGTIRVTAAGATSPVDVTVTQAPTSGTLTVMPTNRAVAKGAGTTTFSVSNAGTGTMPWTAAVVPDSSWLTITSGASGTDTGTITCSFPANTSPSAITGTIQVTALGATGSPVDVTVTQDPASKTPAKPTADPQGGGPEFIISPALLKVTSTSADQIYYTLTSSTDGSQPNEPSIPLPSFPVNLKGNKIDEQGPSGTLKLRYIDGPKTYTIYKVKFQGENASGAGEVSDVLLYTVNQPINQADARQKPDVDYTDSIRKQDGLIDPRMKFLNPEMPATLTAYSVEDLVLEYLRKYYVLPSISSEPRPCKSGTVLIVNDDSWGGTIVPLIVEKITSNAGADTDINKIVAPSGNIEIIYKNILIVLNMAGAYEDQLNHMVVDIQSMRLDYGRGHIVEISSDSDGLRGSKWVYRYQLGAKYPSSLSSVDSYTVGLSVGDSINVDDAGTIKITYDDGTTQNLIPGVIEADVLIKLMGNNGFKTEISPITGEVSTYKGSTTWLGLPYYEFLLQPHKDNEVRYTPVDLTPADDQIVFYSTTGIQVINKKP